MARIHPTAVVASGAEIAEDAEIGPYCVIGPEVRIEAGARLVSHVCIEGQTTLGAGGTVYPFASLGSQTQDLKYRGGVQAVRIGPRTTVREYATVNQATGEGGATQVGADCLLMAYTHVAHDCRVGDGAILANCATLAGHVTIEDQAIVGGLTAVHQFVRIGRVAIVGGCSRVAQDVPPFMMAEGNPLAVYGLNAVGLKRRGVSAEAQDVLKKAFRILYRQGLSTRQALDRIEAEIPAGTEIGQLVAFIRASERGITKGHASSAE